MLAARAASFLDFRLRQLVDSNPDLDWFGESIVQRGAGGHARDLIFATSHGTAIDSGDNFLRLQLNGPNGPILSVHSQPLHVDWVPLHVGWLGHLLLVTTRARYAARFESFQDLVVTDATRSDSADSVGQVEHFLTFLAPDGLQVEIGVRVLALMRHVLGGGPQARRRLLIERQLRVVIHGVHLSKLLRLLNTT